MTRYKVIASNLKGLNVGEVIDDDDLDRLGIDAAKRLATRHLELVRDDTKPARKYAKTITDETEI